MKYNPEIHRRRSIRLKGYDYAQPGAYFVTVCTYQKQCWFGEIRHDQIHLNQIGNIVVREWLKTSQIRPTFKLDEWIVMPNHLHGIVWIMESEIKAIATKNCDRTRQEKKKLNRPANSLGAMIGGFKASVTQQINQFRHNTAIPIWQRNYYESIIRDEEALNSIREYIKNNPKRWQEDPDNPQHHADFSEYLLDLVF
ncbi:MAG: transposase [Spirulina sp.]